MKQSDVVQAFTPAGAAGLKVHTTCSVVLGFVLAIGVAVPPVVLSSQSAPAAASTVDAVFANYSVSTPGCAVGVATGGTPVLARVDDHDVAGRNLLSSRRGGPG